jgi:hypothetical protein
MNKTKNTPLYVITTGDVVNISKRENIPFTDKDLSFIGDKIGDYFGDKWQDAIEYALNELSKHKQPI